MTDIVYENLSQTSFSPGKPAIINISHRMGAYSRFDPHWHRAVEITLCIENPIMVYSEGKVTEVAEGDIICINSGVVHSTEAKDYSRLIRAVVILIPDELFREVTDQYDESRLFIPPGDPGRKQLVNAMERIYRYKTGTQANSAAWINHALWEIIAVLVDRYLTPVLVEKTLPGENRDALAREAMMYIEKNFQKELTLSQTAHQIGFQENYFCRYFKKYVGLSFSQYLAHTRLRYALSYLINDGLSVTDSAARAGFPSEKAFTNWCRRVYGMTPSEYKRQKFSSADNFNPMKNIKSPSE